jgi:hypothetical protein
LFEGTLFKRSTCPPNKMSPIDEMSAIEEESLVISSKENHSYVNGDFQRRVLEEEERLRREVIWQIVA